MQFFGEIWQNRVLPNPNPPPTRGVGAPPPGNPGSATDMVSYLDYFFFIIGTYWKHYWWLRKKSTSLLANGFYFFRQTPQHFLRIERTVSTLLGPLSPVKYLRSIAFYVRQRQTSYSEARFSVTSYCLYRPQRSFGKVMFLHLSVSCLFTGGVCLSACWDTPPRQVHPPAGTPPWAGTPPTGKVDPSRTSTPPGQVYPPGQVHTPPGQVHPPGRYPPSPPTTITPADGTHPAGMANFSATSYCLI